MQKVSFPARCAVAVVCGEHLVSQVYPAAVPVEAFLDNVIDLLNDDLKRRGAASLDSGIAYELQRSNGTRLDVTKTLDEMGIEDGDTLVLAPADRGESFLPQYESLSSGLAEIGRKMFRPVTAHTAVMTAVALLGMMVLTSAGLAVNTRLNSDSWGIAPVLVAFGSVVSMGAFAVWRWWPDQWQLSGGLGWLAAPLLAVGFAAAAPGPVGSAHLFVAALATAVLLCGLVAITGRYLTVAATVITLCGIGGFAAGIRMWHPLAAQRIAMLTLIGLLILLTAAPTIALWVARIRPPHFGSITGRDLFRRGDGMPVDAVAPVQEALDEEPNTDSTPRGAVIAAAARRANSALTGICVAAAIALPATVWTTLIPGEPRSGGAVAVSVLFILIYISRARSFTDRGQAIALVCGAGAALCAGVARYVLSYPPDAVGPLFLGILVMGLFGAAGLAAALLVPVTRFTPLVRMATEWVELAAIVLALPLAAWVAGLFAWVRMR